MSIPHPSPDTEERLRRDDLGLPPTLSARLDARPDLARALSTAMRLCWSREVWAQRQGEELCRALATTDADARTILLAPLAPTDALGVPATRARLTDGPWLPLEVLARLASAVGDEVVPWGPEVTAVEITATAAQELPPIPEGIVRLEIESAPELSLPDDRLATSIGELRVVEAESAEPWETRAIAGHRGWVRAVEWHTGGERWASAGPDGVVQVWGRVARSSRDGENAEAIRGARLAALDGHSRPVHTLAWSPRTLALASASVDGTVRIWQEEAGRWSQRALLDPGGDASGVVPEVADVAWSPDGTRLATVGDDGEVRVWSVTRDGYRPMLLRGKKDAGHAGPVRSVAWAPDGVRLASAGADGAVRLWIDDGERFLDGGVIAERDDWIRALDWSRDGGALAIGSDDGSALLLRFPSARRRGRRLGRGDVEARIELVGHEGWVRRVTFDRSCERLITAGDDGVLRVFEVAAPVEGGECAPAAAIDHAVRITAARWSPSGMWIATGDDAGVLRVVRGDDPSQLIEGHGCEGTIGALAWHPDEGEIVTGSDDRLVRVWRPAQGGLGPVWGRMLGKALGDEHFR